MHRLAPLFGRPSWGGLFAIVAVWALCGLGAVDASAQLLPSDAGAWAGPWETITADANSVDLSEPWWVRVLIYTLWAVIFLILIYTARHYLFTLNRLFGRQRHPYAALDTLDWPDVTVWIAAHNEEAVIGTSLEALLQVDYPAEKLTIMPVNDRSKDRTKEIIDAYVDRYPGRITPFHREGGKPGKAAALNDAIQRTSSDIVITFDADYVPGRDLLKRLVAPFADPEVGSVMGRVIPMNTGANLLTRLLELERTGGYQVDQQARMNMGLVPQYGGTVGGLRMSALNAVGGWRDESLTEDTDVTCRLLMGGWKVAYANRCECYEEVPETWPVRIRQIRRWARGHTDAMIQYTAAIAKSRFLSPRERLDGVLLMGVYAMGPILLLGWILATTLFYLGVHPVHGLLAILAVASYNSVGNFAAFFEIASGARLDGTPRRVRLLPLNLFGFIVSIVATTRATLEELSPVHREFIWHKTERFRQNAPEAPAPENTPPPSAS